MVYIRRWYFRHLWEKLAIINKGLLNRLSTNYITVFNLSHRKAHLGRLAV